MELSVRAGLSVTLAVAVGVSMAFSDVPPPAVEIEEEDESLLRLAPLNAASIWKMKDAGAKNTSFNFNSYDIARNPALSPDKGSYKVDSVYFGVPPKSCASVISLGVIALDTDRFLSSTTFHETSYSTFGFLGFDKDSLSAGVFRKFGSSTVTSIYYNGNIVEDIFAYMSNNSATNGKVGMGASDGGIAGTTYDFLGDLKDRNNINSRSNINLLFGTGVFGIEVGYSQKLFGLVQKSNATPVDGTIKDTQQAILDNAILPYVEFGFHFDREICRYARRWHCKSMSTSGAR